MSGTTASDLQQPDKELKWEADSGSNLPIIIVYQNDFLPLAHHYYQKLSEYVRAGFLILGASECGLETS